MFSTCFDKHDHEEHFLAAARGLVGAGNGSVIDEARKAGVPWATIWAVIGQFGKIVGPVMLQALIAYLNSLTPAHAPAH